MKAVQIQKQGGPEVLNVVDLDIPTPGEGQVLVGLEASGINFIDVYQRSGLYKVELPYVLGLEGTGTVQAVGAGVSGFKEGDRVAYTGVPGSYAEHVLVPADRLVQVPESVGLATAAAVMLQGMTAQYLSHSTYPVQEGDTCLCPRSGRRGGVAADPTRQAARRSRCRHRFDRRKSRARSQGRGRPRDFVHRARF